MSKFSGLNKTQQIKYDQLLKLVCGSLGSKIIMHLSNWVLQII